ncbi:hypothetical protein RHMOL_Rhmol03G0039500 [Rhododendron molle]|uniref:Uncharacterized protein n=1 Tax=Rhododendron molle TaxID=49168 RepID=A0ACC0PBG2_RHOML|nr:hypothetical protein RHMOL_Rhmol03G0039500 [Rhododendron molle]
MIFASRDECEGSQVDHEEREHICGRPLGLCFDEITGNLYIADAYMGLLVVGPEGGLATKVATQAQGISFGFTNSLDIDERNGIVYFSDSSSRFQRRWGGNGLAVRLNGDGDVLEALEDESRNGWKAAWHLCDPDAEKVFKALRTSGVKLAVVSNFDTRLRPLLRALNCDHWFDAVAVSAEVEAEKPNPTIFLKACELLGVKPEDAVHVGDDRRNDIWGARDAGCDAWLWGSDVQSFKEVAQRIGAQV